MLEKERCECCLKGEEGGGLLEGVLGWLYSGASGGVLWQKRGSSRAAKARQQRPAK